MRPAGLAAVALLSFVCLGAAPCKVAPWSVTAPAGEPPLEVSFDARGAHLRSGQKELWSRAGSAWGAAFSPDRQWVAVLAADRLIIVSTRDGAAHDSDVLGLLPPAGRKAALSAGPDWMDAAQKRSACPLSWLDRLAALPEGLLVDVTTGRHTRVTMAARMPSVELFAPWDEPPRELWVEPPADPAEYPGWYRAAKTPVERERRLELACGRKVTSPAEAAAVAAFLDTVLAEPGDKVATVRSVARAIGWLPPAEGLRLAAQALAYRGAGEEELLSALEAHPTAETRALAEAVARDEARTAWVREKALKVAVAEVVGEPAAQTLLLDALATPALRLTAADALTRTPRCSLAHLDLLLADETKAPTDVRYIFHRAVDACLCRSKDPSLHARLGAEEQKPGRQLWADAYLELAFWANARGEGAEASRLLSTGAAKTGEPPTWDHDFSGRAFEAARVLFALSRGDADAGSTALAALDSAPGPAIYDYVCAAKPEDVHRFWSACACEPKIWASEFLNRFSPPAPQRPAKGK